MALLSTSIFSGSVNVVISGSSLLNVEQVEVYTLSRYMAWPLGVVAVIGIAFVQEIPLGFPLVEP